MDQAAGNQRSKMHKGVVGCFIAVGILVLLYWVLGWFDNATELNPRHDNVLQACFVIAGLSGLALGFVGVRKSRTMTVWQRARLAVVLGLMGFLSVTLTSTRIAEIVEQLIDFPPSQTRSYSTLLLISRAYQTHGKGRSWNIQTTPIWSNLEITENDYGFMLAHRRVEDNSGNPDEISSNGYFCAQVTVEQSGNALRVLHAGSHELPKGTVVICPASSSGIRKPWSKD